MGNEMGNRNINGIQVSEQESDATAEVVDHSPNTSFFSLNGLDGLKGVSDHLADGLQTSEKHETQNLAAGDFSEPSLAFDGVENRSQLNSSRENEEKEDTKLLASNESSTSSLVSNKKPTDLASIESQQEDGNLIHRTIPVGQEKEDTKLLASNESSTSSLMSNKKPADFASIESLQEDGNLVHRTIPVGQAPDEECDEANKESAKALTVLNNEDGIEGFPHGLPDCLPEKQVKKVDADKSLENLAASNETEEKIHLISPTEDHDSPDKLYSSAHRESCKVLIQKQTLDNRENQDSKENTANISSEHSAVSNDAEDSLQSISSTDLHDVHGKPSDPDQSDSDESLIQNQIFEETGSEMDSENQDSEENTANKPLEHTAVSNDGEDLTQLFSSTENRDLHEKLSDSAGSEYDESLIQKLIFERREKKDAMTWVQGTSGKCNELQDEKVERATCGATGFMDISEGYTQQEGQQHCAETYTREKSCAASKWEEKGSLEPVNAAYLDAIDNEISILLQTIDLDEVGEQSKSEPNGFQEVQDYYGKATSEEESQMEDIEINDSFDIQLNGIDPCTEEREEQEDVGPEDAMFELAIQTGYSPILVSKEHKEDPVEETNGVEMGDSATLQAGTPVADSKDEERIECGSNKLETPGIVGEQSSELSIANDASTEDAVILSMALSESGTKNSGDTEINGDVIEEMEKTKRLNVNAEVESERPNGEVNGQAKVVADELVDQTTAENTITPTSPLLFESEALENKEELFTIDILRRNPSENEKQVQESSTKIRMMAVNEEHELIPIDSAWCAQPFEPEASQGCGNDSSAAESVKCVTYECESSTYPEGEESTLSYISKTEESKRNPPFSLEMEVSATDENIREYRVSTSHEDVSKLSDRSPLLCQRKSEDSRVSAEETDSEKPRTPFLNFLKEGVGAQESVEEEGLLQKKKTVKESKKSISREKQKPRSSLFSSCMCCKTAIN